MSLNVKNNSFFLCILFFSLCPYTCIFLDCCINSTHTALYSAFVLVIDEIMGNQSRVNQNIIITKDIIYKITQVGGKRKSVLFVEPVLTKLPRNNILKFILVLSEFPLLERSSHVCLWSHWDNWQVFGNPAGSGASFSVFVL